MARKTKAEKLMEATITAAFKKVGNGRLIPMMEIPRIYKAAEAALKVAVVSTPTELLELAEKAIDAAISAVEIKGGAS